METVSIYCTRYLLALALAICVAGAVADQHLLHAGSLTLDQAIQAITVFPHNHKPYNALPGLGSPGNGIGNIGPIMLYPDVPEDPVNDCHVRVLPGDTGHLLKTMANTREGCTLQLEGEYVVNGQSLVINQQLQAAPPVRIQNSGNYWIAPDVFTETSSGIFSCPVQTSDCPLLVNIQPAATLVIEDGIINLGAAGGLQNIGIRDQRPEAVGIPIIVASSLSEKSLKQYFKDVLFDHSPLISDISTDHPYWNSAEPADGGGQIVRTAVRVFSAAGRAGTSRAVSSGHQTRGKGYLSGGGGGGGDDRFSFWRQKMWQSRRYLADQPTNRDIQETLKGITLGGIMVALGIIILAISDLPRSEYHDRRTCAITNELQGIRTSIDRLAAKYPEK